MFRSSSDLTSVVPEQARYLILIHAQTKLIYSPPLRPGVLLDKALDNDTGLHARSNSLFVFSSPHLLAPQRAVA